MCIRDSFLDFAKELGVDGVSLESCFFPSHDKAFYADLKARLDEYGFDRVYAWGHPDGLEAGRNEAAYHDMIKSVEYAAAIGAPVMRICASSFTFRLEPHRPQMEKLVPWLKEGARVAESYGIKMAAENHIDYTSDEWVELLDRVDSPYICLLYTSRCV